ncbi:MAG: thiamine phosphate synthase, partial [Gammaproteobacteria bacterium]
MTAFCALPDKRIAGLYLITPEIPPLELLRLCAAVVPMAAVLQYRAVSPNIQTARKLAGLCAQSGALFMINNNALLAKEAFADGVHLGADDMPVMAARKLLGDNAIIGATCGGDIQMAKQRQKESADYCAFGAVYASKTKPQKPLCPP